MRAQLKSLLIKARIIPPDAPAPAQPAVVTTNIVTASNAPTDADPFYVGLREASIDGWFNAKSGEIYPGMKVTADDTVLDLGCGDGGITSFCARAGADLIIADIDGSKIEQTRQRLLAANAKSVRTLVTDANPLDLPDACVSKVICTEVIEHVDDPAAVLRELARIGKPGTTYLISVPDPTAENLQKPIADPVYFQKPNHIRIIGRDEFCTLIQNAGLEIQSHTTSSFYWAIWWSFFWLCNQNEMKSPWHPLLQTWAQTWQILMNTPNGLTLKAELDRMIAKSQIIVARKPL